MLLILKTLSLCNYKCGDGEFQFLLMLGCFKGFSNNDLIMFQIISMRNLAIWITKLFIRYFNPSGNGRRKSAQLFEFLLFSDHFI